MTQPLCQPWNFRRSLPIEHYLSFSTMRSLFLAKKIAKSLRKRDFIWIFSCWKQSINVIICMANGHTPKKYIERKKQFLVETLVSQNIVGLNSLLMLKGFTTVIKSRKCSHCFTISICRNYYYHLHFWYEHLAQINDSKFEDNPSL